MVGEPIETSCVDGVWRVSVSRDGALPGECRSVSERSRCPRRSEEPPS
jgi:hypothetical protein